MRKGVPAAALAVVAIALTAAPGIAAPLDEPPSKAYVPGNEKLFAKGVKAFDAHDYKKAYAIFDDLAHHDDIAAMRNIAWMERKGLGTPKNLKAALRHYEIAARAGLPTAAADLGQMLLYGEAGPADPKAALPWLKMATRAGHPVAQFMLGQMYEFGEAVPKNRKKAERLYAASATRGYKPAIYRLSYLKGWPPPGSGAKTKPAAPPH